MSLLLRIALPILLLCAAPFATAQTEKRHRIGVLTIAYPQKDLVARTSPPQSGPRLLEEGLKQSGWVDGKNIQFVWKSAEGAPDRLPGLAEELVRERVDVIVVIGIGAIEAAKKTKTIPIVTFGGLSMPVETGVALSLGRPGKNVTGLSLGSEPRILSKVLALLKEATPGASRVAIVLSTWRPPSEVLLDQEDRADIEALRLRAFPVTFWGVSALPGAFEEAVRQGADAMVFLLTPGVFRQPMQDRISELAIRHRMPVVHAYLPEGEWGGILAYGNDVVVGRKRLPYFVDRILRGANPADIPIEEPTKFELHVNLKAAKAIGVAVPQSVLVQADRIIQ